LLYLITLSETHIHSAGLLRTRDRHVADLLTTHIYLRQISIPPEVFEPTIPAKEKPQTDALNLAAPGIGVGNIDPRKVLFDRLMTALESAQRSVGTFNRETRQAAWKHFKNGRLVSWLSCNG